MTLRNLFDSLEAIAHRADVDAERACRIDQLEALVGQRTQRLQQRFAARSRDKRRHEPLDEHVARVRVAEKRAGKENLVESMQSSWTQASGSKASTSFEPVAIPSMPECNAADCHGRALVAHRFPQCRRARASAGRMNFI